MNLSNFKINFYLKVWALNALVQLGQETLPGRKCRTLTSLFTNMASFYSESKDEPNELLKRQNKHC